MVTNYLNKKFKAAVDLPGVADAGETFTYNTKMADAGLSAEAWLISGAVDPADGHDKAYDVSPLPGSGAGQPRVVSTSKNPPALVTTSSADKTDKGA